MLTISPEDTITCGLDKELWVFTFQIDCKKIANFRRSDGGFSVLITELVF